VTLLAVLCLTWHSGTAHVSKHVQIGPGHEVSLGVHHQSEVEPTAGSESRGPGSVPAQSTSTDHPSLQLVERLTDRERQVFALLASGPSNRELARRLSITERTVKAHISKIMNKAGADTRTRLCILSHTATVLYWPEGQ
jgi:DNA-binding NarL/FixJ family response regulator